MDTPQPAPRRRVPPVSVAEARPVPVAKGQSRFWGHAMLFVACVLLVNGLFGERGLMQTMRARRAFAASERELARIRRENAGLRDFAHRLRNDPATIEGVAREELGLARQGEIVVTVKDVK